MLTSANVSAKQYMLYKLFAREIHETATLFSFFQTSMGQVLYRTQSLLETTCTSEDQLLNAVRKLQRCYD